MTEKLIRRSFPEALSLPDAFPSHPGVLPAKAEGSNGARTPVALQTADHAQAACSLPPWNPQGWLLTPGASEAPPQPEREEQNETVTLGVHTESDVQQVLRGGRSRK